MVEDAISANILYSSVPLSFWGGTDPATGNIVDKHHPLSGCNVRGQILALPCGRGSCTGSVVMLELLLNGHAPAALVFSSREEILIAGVIVARVLFQKSIPVFLLEEDQFKMLEHEKEASIVGEYLIIPGPSAKIRSLFAEEDDSYRSHLMLTARDHEILDGQHGRAAAIAMEIVVEFALLQEAKALIDITQAHIDSCVYTGPAGLLFAEHMLGLGGSKYAVPTSMNSISVDRQRWQVLGMEAELVEKGNRLADAHIAMGAKPTFTCAPYLLDTAPKKGQHVGWGKSNAVVFANSVLGAYTQKYPDLIDVCIALTGRTPKAGCHSPSARVPSVIIRAPDVTGSDDSFYPLLGYCVGQISGNRIPLVLGLETAEPGISDLKAFGAAFATTSSAPMFHIRGVTPNYLDTNTAVVYLNPRTISLSELQPCWRSLNTACGPGVSLVALGNPHFSIEEFEILDRLVSSINATKHDGVDLMITTSRQILDQASRSGIVDRLVDFGASLITDTCWCMITEPVIRPNSGNIMTTSAKYAHYAPGMVSRNVHFGSLAECVEACRTGKRLSRLPAWLDPVVAGNSE